MTEPLRDSSAVWRPLPTGAMRVIDDALERALRDLAEDSASACGDSGIEAVHVLVRAFVAVRRGCGLAPEAAVIDLKALLGRAGLTAVPTDDTGSLGATTVRWAIESYFGDSACAAPRQAD